MKLIIILLIIVVVLFFLGRKSDDNTEKKNYEEDSSSGRVFQESEQIKSHLDEIYKTYLEMKENGLEKYLIAIKLFPTPSNIDKSKLSVKISIQFDGTWFWAHIKNDFIPYLYEVGMYEEFREYTFIGIDAGSWDDVKRKIEVFLQEYKASNADKGEFLNLINV